MGVNLVAAIWGFAEATLFFIVPDVWLSIVGRKRLKTGLQACLYSSAAALLGGTILYLWGYNNFANASEVIEKVPAVSHEMLVRVGTDLSEHGVWAIMFAPLSGTPYKVYAVQAANTGIGLWPFILISIPARLVRFFLITVFSHYALRAFSKLNTKIDPLAVLIVSWVIFYTYYFSIMAD